MSDAAICLTILVAAIGLFVANVLPVEIVALGVALALYASGVIELGAAFAGFGDPVVVFLAALFVVSEGIDATGVTTWTSRRVVQLVGTRRRRLLVWTMLIGAIVACLISPNGAVAALLPMSVMTARRAHQSPSLVAMPLAFAAGSGALLVLTGSPINLMASAAAAGSGHGGFGFWSFAWVGVPLVAGTIAIVLAFAPRVLPERRGPRVADLSEHAETLASEYAVPVDIDVQHGLAEVVIPPRSRYLGEQASVGDRTEGGLEVVGLQRGGAPCVGPIALRVGDVLLVRGPWDRIEQNVRDHDVLVVDAPERIRRQGVPMGPRGGRALAILIGMVVLLSLDLVPASIAALLAACAMVLTRVVRLEQAYHAISWTTVVMVAGMIPLSTAITDSGAARAIGDTLVQIVGAAGPLGLMGGLFAVIALLGQFVSNTATALIMFPIAQASAAAMGLSPVPFLMLVAVASASSLLTPIGTPANMMVMGPGGYRFGDYWRLGAPVLVWYFVVCVAVIPQVWRFEPA
ncbi:MAG: SLC13 family permease [Kofleriaceae bacterium]|nr:SLC13 family permease [Kofleriaceae bacterium]